MRLNDYFDHIYCVNLDKRTDKWADCVKLFEKHALTVERFSAVDGRKLPYNMRGRISPGEAGCSLSHLAIYKDVLSRKFNRVLILEDDIDFIANLTETFASSVPDIPEWDLLYLGGTHMVPPTRVNQSIGKIIKTYSTSHYALTSEVASKLLQSVEQCQSQVDVVISQFQPHLRSYVFMPSIAWQRPSISDIHGVYVDYTPFMKPSR